MIAEALFALGGLGFGGVAGGVIGWTAHVVRARHARPVERQTVCGCRHHLSMHDPRTGECHATIEQPDKWYSGTPLSYKHVPCTCRQYVGPEPLAEFTVAELPVENVSRQIVSAPRTDET